MNNQVQAIYEKYPTMVSLPVTDHKSPTADGTGWQERTTSPTVEEIQGWSVSAYSLGLVCGTANGGLEVLDFDHAGSAWTEFEKLVNQYRPNLLSSLPLVRTPSGGYHLYFRCPVNEGNQKLAAFRIPDGKDKDGKDKYKHITLIETRGQGGYVVSPHTVLPDGKKYELLTAIDIDQTPTITPDDRKLLLNIARSLTLIPVGEKKTKTTKQQSDGEKSGRPGDDFNRRANWSDILPPHGWSQDGIGTAGSTRWTRPDKTMGVSATTGYCGEDHLYIFSSNAHPFEMGETYSKFAAYAVLNHGGDFKKAAEELAAKGYGDGLAAGAAASTIDRINNPIPFETPETKETKVSPFPVDALPSPMREVVTETAKTIGCDPALPATWALSTLSASTGNLAEIHQGEFTHLGTGLMFLIVSDSGSNKTLSGKHIIKPFIDAQDCISAKFNNEILPDLRAKRASKQSQRTGLLAKLANIKAGKGNNSESSIPAINEELKKIERDLLDIQREKKGNAWIVDDITPEKLISTMTETYGRAAFLASEAKAIHNILGHTYGTGSQIDYLCKAFDRERLTKQRIGTPDTFDSLISVNVPDVALVASFTPEIFGSMMNKPQFRSSGFLSRCLVLSPPPSRRSFGKTIDPLSIANWSEKIDDLCDIQVPVDALGNVTPVSLRMTDEAYQDHIAYCQRAADKLFDKEEIDSDYKAFTNRFSIIPLRIAAQFHFLRHRADYAKHSICLEDIRNARRVYMYYVHQFRAMMDHSASGGMSIPDQNLNKLMQYANKREAFTKKQALKGIRWINGNRPVSIVGNETLQDAIDKGWITFDKTNYRISDAYKEYQKKARAK